MDPPPTTIGMEGITIESWNWSVVYPPLLMLGYVQSTVLFIMGNFQDQFENVREQASEISQRHRIQNTVITHRHHSLFHSQLPKQELLPPAVDHELLHSTVLRREHPIQKSIAVEVQREEPASEESETGRERLQQLDLSFYQRLALLDYEFREIPREYSREYANLETVEQKDMHGIKYVGEWKDGLLHGNGILVSNTSKYIGQFRSGLKHFHGREIFRGEVYEGEFQAGRRRGLGVRYTQAATEVGVFDGHLIFGTIKYANGNEYKGTLKHNKYHGGGVDFSSPAVTRTAEFNVLFPDEYLKNSARRQIEEHPDDGKGNVFYDAETNTSYQNCTFQMGVMTYAKVIYSNGNSYEGQLQKGRKHGNGIFRWKDGSVYEGQYQWDQKHGRGTLKTGGREYRDKQFVNGEMREEIESVIDDQNSEMPAEWQ